MNRVYLTVVFKSGRKLSFYIEGYTSFRDAANNLLSGQWNVIDTFAFNTNEVESIAEDKEHE